MSRRKRLVEVKAVGGGGAAERAENIHLHVSCSASELHFQPHPFPPLSPLRPLIFHFLSPFFLIGFIFKYPKII